MRSEVDYGVQCGECQAYGGHHHPLCSKMTPEKRAETADFYYRAWLGKENETRTMRDRLSHQVAFWQGKFNTMKTENNALRKQLRKARKK